MYPHPPCTLAVYPGPAAVAEPVCSHPPALPASTAVSHFAVLVDQDQESGGGEEGRKNQLVVAAGRFGAV